MQRSIHRRLYMLVCAIGLGWLLSCLTGCTTTNSPSRTASSERLLFSFERATVLPMLSGSAPRRLVSEHATHGKRCLRLQLAPKAETVIFDSTTFPMDWRGWDVLKLDVFREGSPLVLNLRVTDKNGRHHWVWSTPVMPGPNTLQYNLSVFVGKVDLSAVTELMWYAEEPRGTLYLDHIRLSKGFSAHSQNT